MSTDKLSDAYHAAVRAHRALLLSWRMNLPDERKRQVDAFEAKGLRLGLQMLMPRDDWIVNVVLLDNRGGIVTLETIENNLRGASLAIN